MSLLNRFFGEKKTSTPVRRPLKQPRSLGPPQCSKCAAPITEEHILRNICPFLDSMGSRRAFLFCQTCAAPIDFMVGRHAEFVSVTQVEIIGVPGPEYVEIAKTEIRPAPKVLGWYLEDRLEDLWRDRQWDWYLRNWLTEGINALCAGAGGWAERVERTGEPIVVEELERFAFSVWLFSKTYYDEPLATEAPDLNLTLGKNHRSDTEAGRRDLLRAARDLGDVGYSVYHGGVLDESWLRDSYPRLLGTLAHFASLLPSQSKFDSEPKSIERGVMLGGSHFEEGVNFVEAEERAAFEVGAWEGLPAGTLKMAQKFFGNIVESAGTMRILVHTGGGWSTWRCFGPFAPADVDRELKRLSELFPPQRRLGPRTYEARGSRANKFEIYDGRKLIKDVNPLEG